MRLRHSLSRTWEMLNEQINQFIASTGSVGNSFVEKWSTISLLYNLANFDLRNINMNHDFFNDLDIAWNISKASLQEDMDDEVYDKIEKFMLEIEQELQ